MFRFTSRDLLWLMVVVGLTAGWWIDRSKVAGEREEMRQFVRKFAIEYNLELDERGKKLLLTEPLDRTGP